MRWFDTHVHLDSPRFERDRALVLQRAQQHGVAGMLNVGFDLASSQAAASLAAGHEGIWAAAGLHPHYASQYDDELSQGIASLLQLPRVRALGEIGLDFYRDLSPRPVQRHAFGQLLGLAVASGVPVIIHDRDAHAEVVDILKAHEIDRCGGVMHCFSGDVTLARRCLDLGLHIALAGPVTYARAHDLQEVARFIPLERLLVETDCPYLPPAPHRGKRNEPALVRLVGETIAGLRGMDPASLGEITLLNACRLFGIALAAD